MRMFSIHAALIVVGMALLSLAPTDAQATCTTQQQVTFGDGGAQFTGSCTDDNEVLVTVDDARNFDACTIMSLTGAVDVFTSLDGSTYATAARSLQDFGASDTAPVTVTSALREYAIVGKWRSVRVVQNGATDASVVVNCWKL